MLYNPELRQLGLPTKDLASPVDRSEPDGFSRHLTREEYIRARAGVAAIVSSIERVKR